MFNFGCDNCSVINVIMVGNLNGLKLLLDIERESYLENLFYLFVGFIVLVYD